MLSLGSETRLLIVILKELSLMKQRNSCNENIMVCKYSWGSLDRIYSSYIHPEFWPVLLIRTTMKREFVNQGQTIPMILNEQISNYGRVMRQGFVHLHYFLPRENRWSLY